MPLHVRHISHGETEAEAADVCQVLRDLGINPGRDDRLVEVWNKADLLGAEDRARLATIAAHLVVRFVGLPPHPIKLVRAVAQPGSVPNRLEAELLSWQSFQTRAKGAEESQTLITNVILREALGWNEQVSFAPGVCSTRRPVLHAPAQ